MAVDAMEFSLVTLFCMLNWKENWTTEEHWHLTWKVVFFWLEGKVLLTRQWYCLASLDSGGFRRFHARSFCRIADFLPRETFRRLLLVHRQCFQRFVQLDSLINTLLHFQYNTIRRTLQRILVDCQPEFPAEKMRQKSINLLFNWPQMLASYEMVLESLQKCSLPLLIFFTTLWKLSQLTANIGALNLMKT